MLKILRHLIQEINDAENLDEALRVTVRNVRDALGTQACSVFLVDKETSDLVLSATDGLNPDMVGKAKVSAGFGLVGLVVEREEPINIEDASKHPRFFFIQELKESDYRAYLAVPILYHRDLLGVLVVQQEEIRRYDEAEEAFLMTFAVQLGKFIVRAESKKIELAAKEKAFFSLKGLSSLPGIGIGKGFVVYARADLNLIPDIEVTDVESEADRFKNALAACREEMEILGKRLSTSLPKEEQALFDAYLKILDSPSLSKQIIAEIRKGFWAQGALRKVIKKHIHQFEMMEDEYFRERAVDLRDLGQRILAHLQKEDQVEREYPSHCILVGEEINATDIANVPSGQLTGIVSAHGSTNSHVAILANELGIPAVMGVGELSIDQLQNKKLIVDGYFGQVHVSPSPRLLGAFYKLMREDYELDKELEYLRDLPAETKDGHRISMYVNTGLMADVGRSLTVGAEGVGLYRTEVPFMMRDRFPSAEEQRVLYRQLLSAFSPLPVTIRILDIGGDKPLSYFPIEESNPFLGWRGIRMMLDQPEIFLVQVRSILKASAGFNNLSIMLPMITNVSEVKEALKLINNGYKEVLEEGFDVVMPKVGVMVEVPSAIYQAEVLAKHTDFLSIGSNDLTQYLLAVDRNNEQVSDLYDALHPAVIKALYQIVRAAQKMKKPVSICGELASDPAGVILLLAMGFNILSMNASYLLRMKWVVRSCTLSQAKKMLNDVLKMENVWQIRCYLESELEKLGLGGLIRAGKY